MSHFHEPPPPSAAEREGQHLENFSVADFFTHGWESIEAKTMLFGPFFSQLRSEGSLMREAIGPAQAHEAFRDPATGGPHEVLMLGSNSYLGLANEPFVKERVIDAVRTWGVGCGGPPLLNGTTSLHIQLEEELAQLKSCEAALIWTSGYNTNVGWTNGLLDKNDVLIFDAQSHASLYDGTRMGRFSARRFLHNDLDDLRKSLMEVRRQAPYANVIVCVEGVYSMDGDLAPLPAIRELTSKYGALLAVDDAHGTGVMGATGRGTAEHFGMEGDIDIAMGTFSKVFAVNGGFVAASRNIVDYLRIFSRSYMFSAALAPPIVASVLAGIEFIREHPERIKQLHDNVAYFCEALRAVGYHIAVETAVIPIMLPAGADARAVVCSLFDKGVFVNGVQYPAVAKDRQRLRLSMMATLTRSDLDFAAEQLALVGREFDLLPQNFNGTWVTTDTKGVQ